MNLKFWILTLKRMYKFSGKKRSKREEKAKQEGDTSRNGLTIKNLTRRKFLQICTGTG